MRNKRLISLILAFVLVFSFSVSSFADFSATDSLNLNSIEDYVRIYLPHVSTFASQTSILTLLSQNLAYIRTDIASSEDALSSIRTFVRRIEEVVADATDLESKSASKQNQQAFTDNFLSGDNSVSTSNIGALSGLGSSFKNFFSMTGAGGGSAEVDISAWSDLLVSDEPFTFFVEADTIAEAMGVEAGGYISNPDIPDDPNDPDEPVEPDEPNPPAPTYSSYVVHYYIENTTTTVATDKTVNNVVVGSTVSETAPSVTGYNLVSTSPQTLLISNVVADNVITFYYSVIPDEPEPPAPTYSSYVVHYYVENTTTTVATDKTVNNVVVGSTVTETAPSVTGYNLVSTSPQTLLISNVVANNVITFYYSVIPDEPEPVQHYLTYSGYFYNSSGNPILNATVFNNANDVSSGYELQDGDIIRVLLHRSSSYRFSLVYNGVTYNYNSSNVTIDVYQSDIVFEGTRSSSSSSSSTECIVTFKYHDSPAPAQAPLRMLRSAPVDTSNTVVTHYYQDNLSKLFGFLRGD